MSKQYPGGIISKTPVVPSGPYETSTASGIWTLDQQAYWRKLNQWPIAGSPAPDAQFNYVTMLLHGDGTNGAQNNTFLDSSTNNFTITRNGNTTQGSFSPYGSNWSNYFNGSSYLSLATATGLGTSNLTVEFWFNTSDTSATYYALYDGRSSVNTDTGLGIFQYGQTIEIYGNGLKVSSAASAFTANTWTHFAVVRTSGTCQIYINGVASGSSASYSNNLNSTSRRIAQGTNGSNTYTGYISNLREVTSALYSGTFTPSTTPLTAVSGTTLLTCQSNRFVDNSTNNYVITLNGTPSVQRFNPFGTATAYSTSVIGGSGYFDGSGDYLTWTSGSSIAFGTGDFTVECWIYLNATPTTNFLFDFRDSLNVTAPAFIWGNNTSGVLDWTQNAASGPSISSSSATWKLNTWYHVAYVRSGTTGTIYQNGVSVGSGTDSTNYLIASTTSTIAARYGSPFLEFPGGYISDVRIVKGTAVYTGAFTPPTAPLTAITNTVLLAKMTNGAIFDNAMMNDLETVGNAQISTSVKKYGTGSLAFDGTGDWLTIPSLPSLNYGTGNFTVELWMYSNSAPGSDAGVIDQRPLSTNGSYFMLGVNSSNQLFIYVNTSYRIGPTSGTAIANSTWYHVAYVRSSTTGTLYINGTSVGTWSDTTTYLQGAGFIGHHSFAAADFNGYMDDIRITTGYARYTANFTPPTAAFFNTGPT